MIYKCNKCNFSMDYVEGSIINQNCPDCSNGKLSAVEEEKLNILDEAFKIINGERQDQYRAPEDNFQIIASFWSTYLKQGGKLGETSIGVSALDVAHMMTLFKVARMLGQRPSRDNYRDAIGYLAIAADRLSRRNETN